MVTVEGSTKGRGRPKLTLAAVVQKDLRLLHISVHDALNRAH